MPVQNVIDRSLYHERWALSQKLPSQICTGAVQCADDISSNARIWSYAIAHTWSTLYIINKWSMSYNVLNPSTYQRAYDTRKTRDIIPRFWPRERTSAVSSFARTHSTVGRHTTFILQCHVNANEQIRIAAGLFKKKFLIHRFLSFFQLICSAHGKGKKNKLFFF